MGTTTALLERLRSNRAVRAVGATLALAAIVAACAPALVAAADVAPSGGSAGPRPTVGGAPALTTTGAVPAALTASTEATSSPSTPTVAPSIVPTSKRIAAATKWLKSREGVVGFAVVDSAGKLSGYHTRTRFVTASVVKAMLLVGYLRTHTRLSTSAKSTLTRMIHVSDNNAATAIYKIVGDSGLRKVAKAAGMRDFSVSVSWGRAQLTPADQARFFYKMDRLIPARYRTFARYQLSHITAAQSWGIPATARPKGWTVFFKGGWRTTVRGQLVHQVARLEGKTATFSVAVMTDGDPSMGYGINTISGVMKRLLGLAR
jgi:hypothetical protein